MSNSVLPPIEGLKYVPDFVNKKEEKQLLKEIARATWEDLYVRRVQQYGYRYHFLKRTMDHVSTHTPLPGWAAQLTQAFLIRQYLNTLPDLLIVNEYKAGEGIKPHIDSPLLFGETILIVSLEADCIMELEPMPEVGQGKQALALAARSLLVMQGEVRHHWQHSIVNVQKRRVSLTFRTVKDEYKK
ncbi:alpha-ketoglutarate-dependent dioxygenase AlkB [uncultured Microscilla sp.]|uniref:alpha-ketoglutarate-dependent dioxygenase AlkB n=1 Tax=uncultured Microscilla sp. TaxID=432653 RepID=UPI0026337C34|nr:alpha-ketoglutarate-dependent dioxygenase AlkB [uncultured Microscilla sp.]